MNVIPASVLISAEPENENLRGKLERLLRNKLVLVGTDIEGTTETITSPVHGQLLSVLLHAMATENLIRLESGYLKSNGSAGEGASLASVLWACAILIPIAMFAAHVPLTPFRQPAELSGLALLILYAFLSWNFSSAVLFILSGLILYVIAPMALARAVISFSAVVFVSVAAVELGYEPRNVLILGMAAILVHEKVHSDLHGGTEKGVVLGRLTVVRDYCRVKTRSVLRYLNKGAFR